MKALAFVECCGEFDSAVREQCRKARLRSMTKTGCGFYANVDLPDDVRRTERAAFQISSIFGRHPSLANSFGFVLFFENGQLQMIEACTFGDDEWLGCASSEIEVFTQDITGV